MSTSASASTIPYYNTSSATSPSWMSFYMNAAPWTEIGWSMRDSFTLIPDKGDRFRGKIKPPKYHGVQPSNGYGRIITLNGRRMRLK